MKERFKIMIRNISRLFREEPKGKTYKYSIGYCSGATGFGWEDACDTIEEVEQVIFDIRTTHTAMVTVFDNNLGDFIFYKRALSEPETDMIHSYKRDLRTATRQCLCYSK